jgi:hypothetical protein
VVKATLNLPRIAATIHPDKIPFEIILRIFDLTASPNGPISKVTETFLKNRTRYWHRKKDASC